MRNFIQSTIDRVHREMQEAGSGRFDFSFQPFSSFHVYQGHHIGRMLVRLIRGEEVVLGEDMIKKLLWRPNSYSAKGMVPAHFSDIRYAIFLESLLGRLPCDLILYGQEVGGLLKNIKLYTEGSALWIEDGMLDLRPRIQTVLPRDHPGRTHYQVELDGVGPIVAAIMEGNREIVVHLKSLFDNGKHGRAQPTALATSTVEMLLHVLIERYNSCGSYQGKAGALALKHLIHTALFSKRADRVRLVPGPYLSTRVEIYDNHNRNEPLYGFEVDVNGVSFFPGLEFIPYSPVLVMPTHSQWATACAVPAEELLKLKEGVRIGDVTIGKVYNRTVAMLKKENEHLRVLLVLSEDRLEAVSCENGKTIFSAAYTQPQVQYFGAGGCTL